MGVQPAWTLLYVEVLTRQAEINRIKKYEESGKNAVLFQEVPFDPCYNNTKYEFEIERQFYGRHS